ncbi:MFS transporter [Chryseolinea sp. H1M3-3]|uniref:MFS transporter n=1 Tax=Chryseolinea sp. H1M3-3 TaxID=3034144 RepID=UPI0023EAE089|nr:MFS transporter [Chryseolinea sp. H1M3-3]
MTTKPNPSVVENLKNVNQAIGSYRWTICALVFFATTVNYIDRQVISLLKSDLTAEFNWNDGDYADIEIAFKIAYALGMLISGRVIDKVGTKIGYFLATFLWSVAAVGHGLVSSTLGFIVARSALGVTESANFPAAIKTVAEWFPKRERALATGIFNSGTNIGAVVAPLTVPYIMVAWGWKWAFIITGSIGFIWVVLWLMYYETPAKHKKLLKPEFDYIHDDADDKADELKKEEKVSWIKLLGFKQTWAFVMGKFLTDPIWWFYLFWLPDFLESQYGIKGTQLALPVATVYILTTIGSVGGGWLPMYLIKNNWPAFKARKTSMLIYAFMVIPIVFAQILGEMNMWLAVLVIGFAASAHQAWSANIFTTVSDMFPKKAVGSVTGIGGMFGSIGGILLSLLVQKSLFVHYRAIGEIETAYYIMFIICGSAYLLAWLTLHLLAPRIERVKL